MSKALKMQGDTALPKLRKFETGATRDTDSGKHDPEGFNSPIVEQRFNEFMHKHRHQSDGQLRDSDNWQKGIPATAYLKSLMRHLHQVHLLHRGYEAFDNLGPVDLEDALCAIRFNADGYLFEILKARGYARKDGVAPKQES